MPFLSTRTITPPSPPPPPCTVQPRSELALELLRETRTTSTGPAKPRERRGGSDHDTVEPSRLGRAMGKVKQLAQAGKDKVAARYKRKDDTVELLDSLEPRSIQTGTPKNIFDDV